MPDSTPAPQSREIIRRTANGWFMLLVNLAILFTGVTLIVTSLIHITQTSRFTPWIIVGFLMEPIAIILLTGHFTLQPNEARVLILFGSYPGTVRESGFFWANPFYSRGLTGRGLITKISLRARNFNSDKIKVNDKRGNPIEIAAVIGWRVADTARAAFDVNDYGSYVQIQSEAAIRHIASLYSYDRGDDEDTEPTLRDSADEVAAALERELAARLEKSGVKVDEARLTHLAYAQEIAQAMLRRQQAEAVIAARKKIVHGAVSMVEMALHELSEKAVVQMDEERKAAMVSNLLVVLCGESQVTPVVNTGTLYN